jgi:hypothetical protein
MSVCFAAADVLLLIVTSPALVLQSTEGSALLLHFVLAISADFKERLCDPSGRTPPLLPLPASLLQGVSLSGSPETLALQKANKKLLSFLFGKQQVADLCNYIALQ